MSIREITDLPSAIAAIKELQEAQSKMQDEIDNLLKEVFRLSTVLPWDTKRDVNDKFEKINLTPISISTEYSAYYSETFSDKTTTIISATSDKTVLEQLRDHLVGENSLYTKYLSSIIIEKGKGNIAPTTTYTEDIFTVSPNTLLSWPDGFYLNCVNKEVQFLISTGLPYMMFCLDGLPGNNSRLLVYEFGEGEIKSLFINPFDEDIPIEKLIVICKELEEALSRYQ